MKIILSTLVIGLALGQTLHAQDTSGQPANTSTTPPAVATGTGESNTAAAPVSGKNSFTEAQAQHRLQQHGYSDVSPLKQDDKSIWRGTASKDGKQVNVAVDYQGNIAAQ